MIVAGSHTLFKKLSIRAFRRAKHTNIKRLKKPRSMGRHTEADNCILLAKIIKLSSQMTSMAIKNE